MTLGLRADRRLIRTLLQGTTFAAALAVCSVSLGQCGGGGGGGGGGRMGGGMMAGGMGSTGTTTGTTGTTTTTTAALASMVANQQAAQNQQTLAALYQQQQYYAALARQEQQRQQREFEVRERQRVRRTAAMQEKLAARDARREAIKTAKNKTKTTTQSAAVERPKSSRPTLSRS